MITRLWEEDHPVNFSGEYYQLRDALLLPRPQRPGGPPILIGGNGIQRTLPLAARYADEWNAVFLTPEKFNRRSQMLDELLVSAGRSPQSVRRSMMAGCLYARDRDELKRKLAARPHGQSTLSELREFGVVAGTGEDMVAQLEQLAQAGLQRVMLQWLDLDDIDGLQAMAEDLLPHFQPV